MSFWDRNNTELMERVKKTEVKSENNTGEILAIRQDIEINDLRYTEDIKRLFQEVNELKKQLFERENEKNEEIDVFQTESEMVSQNPSILTCVEIARCLNPEFPNLDQTAFRYYLYEKGVLNLIINREKNGYSLKDDSELSENELTFYLCKKPTKSGKRVTYAFSKDILTYLKSDSENLKLSINRYLKKRKQYKKSKEKLNTLQVENYKKELQDLCGIKDKYDSKKWGMVYAKYDSVNTNWRKDYEDYYSLMVKQTNGKFKPTKLTYIIQECKDGDVLLRIACELFVN